MRDTYCSDGCLDKIGNVFASHLSAAGISSFEKLAETDPRRIENVRLLWLVELIFL